MTGNNLTRGRLCPGLRTPLPAPVVSVGLADHPSLASEIRRSGCGILVRWNEGVARGMSNFRGKSGVYEVTAYQHKPSRNPSCYRSKVAHHTPLT
jgi:hypothetical protein